MPTRIHSRALWGLLALIAATLTSGLVWAVSPTGTLTRAMYQTSQQQHHVNIEVHSDQGVWTARTSTHPDHGHLGQIRLADEQPALDLASADGELLLRRRQGPLPQQLVPYASDLPARWTARPPNQVVSALTDQVRDHPLRTARTLVGNVRPAEPGFVTDGLDVDLRPGTGGIDPSGGRWLQADVELADGAHLARTTLADADIRAGVAAAAITDPAEMSVPALLVRIEDGQVTHVVIDVQQATDAWTGESRQAPRALAGIDHLVVELHETEGRG